MAGTSGVDMVEDAVGVPEIHKTVNTWIFDYTYHAAFEEFKKTHTVEWTITRDFIQGSLQNPMHMCPKSKLKHRLILIMCKLADGTDPNTRYEEDEDLTALEEVLELFPDLLDWCDDRREWNNCVLELRRQAVYVCCAGNNFPLAHEVYRRVFPTVVKKENKRLKAEVMAALEEESPECKLIRAHPYSVLLEKVIVLIEHINKHHMTPSSLLQAVQKQLPGFTRNVQTDVLPDLLGVTLDQHEMRMLMEESQMSYLAGKFVELPKKLRLQWNAKLQRIRKDREYYLGVASTVVPSSGGDSDVVEERSVRESTPERRHRLVKDADDRINSLRRAIKVMQKNHDPDTKSTRPRDSSGSTSSPEPASPQVERKREPSKRKHGDRDRGSGKKRPQRNTESPKSDSSDMSDSGNETSDKRDIRTFRFRRNENREDRHAMAEDEDEDKRTDLPDLEGGGDRRSSEIGKVSCGLPAARRLRRSLALDVSTRVPGKRLPWTDEEELDLYFAVVDCGVGNWAQIQKAYGFDNRTNVNLKDKWRTMVNTGRKQKLDKKYGNS